MDKLDEKLFEIYNNKEIAPRECEKVIKQALNENTIKKKTNIISKSIAICAGILVIFGVSYAGKITYEKIWKEPKEYSSYEDMLENKRQEYLESVEKVKEEEKENIISEEEARNIALSFMEKFNLNKKITSIKLVKNMYEDLENAYIVQTNNNINKGIVISIDARTGELVRCCNNDLLYKEMNPDKVSGENARNIANEIYIKAIGDKYKDYELYKIEEVPHYMRQVANKIWEAKWGINYDGAFYKLDYISITFIVKNGKIILNSFGIIKDKDFENNPIIISENQAIEIAKEKDRKITQKEINTIEYKIKIENMNPFIYAQEKSGGKDDGKEKEQLSENKVVIYEKYKTEKKFRKIWAVKIDYKDSKQGEQDYKGRVYYVDTTTGEIIGGIWGTLWNYM